MLQTFTNKYLGNIGIIIIDDKPYFEGSKVANILGYSNPHAAINRHCKEPGLTFREVEVLTGKKRDGSDAIQKVMKVFLDEGNIYRLILRSKKPEAVVFERWVMDEVLPSIRRYSKNVSSENDIENLINICKTQQNSIQNLIQDRVNSQSFIDIGKTVASSDDSISIGGFAKLLHSLGMNIGRNKLFSWFRANGYIMNQNGENQPKQVYIERGLFVIRQYSVNTSEGVKINVTPYITGKGQAYFIDKIIGGDTLYANRKFK